jgi:hypothetical protein
MFFTFWTYYIFFKNTHNTQKENQEKKASGDPADQMRNRELIIQKLIATSPVN